MGLNKKKNLLLLCLALETFLASYGLISAPQAAVVSVVYIGAALVFIYLMLHLPAVRLPARTDIKKQSFVKLPLLITMMVLAFITTRYWLDEIPLDPDFADMLPIIKVMNERFLHDGVQHVYDPVKLIWNGTLPIYLPAMWLPYLPAVAVQADLRWVTVIALLLSFITVLALISFRRNGRYAWGQMLVLAMLFWWLFARNDVHGFISMSEEGMVVLYFVFLTVAIMSDSALLMGIAASLCMLSRYSMIGWLLPCIIFFLSKNDYRKLIVFSVTGLLIFLVLFWFPFGFATFQQMVLLPHSYVAFAEKVWENSPDVYWLNLGLAKFYGRYRMQLLHQSLLVLSFAIPLLFIGFCLMQKKWKLNNINLASFKLSLLVFYQFIDVPYGYLFYTNVFVSMIIAALMLNPERTVPFPEASR